MLLSHIFSLKMCRYECAYIFRVVVVQNFLVFLLQIFIYINSSPSPYLTFQVNFTSCHKKNDSDFATGIFQYFQLVRTSHKTRDILLCLKSNDVKITMINLKTSIFMQQCHQTKSLPRIWSFLLQCII